jgi:uncharacterized membrane protein
MLTLDRFFAADVVLRISSRVGGWLGDFEEVGMSPRQSYELRNSDAEMLDRQMAIMCYLSVFGWYVAYRMPRHKRGTLVSYHLRQMTLLLLVSTVLLASELILVPLFGWGAMIVAGVGFSLTLLMRMLGLMAAMSGAYEPLPLVGRLAHRVFAHL